MHSQGVVWAGEPRPIGRVAVARKCHTVLRCLRMALLFVHWLGGWVATPQLTGILTEGPVAPPLNPTCRLQARQRAAHRRVAGQGDRPWDLSPAARQQHGTVGRHSGICG